MEKIVDTLVKAAGKSGIQRMVVGALVGKDDTFSQILLLRRSASDFMGSIWELPSGKVETGESLLDALNREVTEETGLSIKEVKSYVDSFDYKSKSGSLTRQFNFRVLTDGVYTDSKLSSEHDGLVWCYLHEVHSYNITDSVKRSLFINDQLLRLPILLESAKKDGIDRLVVGAVLSCSSKATSAHQVFYPSADSADSSLILAIQRASDDFMGGIWELPSGKVDQGEDLLTTLTREVKEETGLEVHCPTEYLGSFDYVSGSGKKTRQFNFAVSVVHPSPVSLTPSEHSNYKWISNREVETVGFTEETKKIVKSFFQNHTAEEVLPASKKARVRL
jgi:8-oxo-dGTP diphosphatase